MGIERDGLYMLCPQLKNSISSYYLNSDYIYKLHCRLGHPSTVALRLLFYKLRIILNLKVKLECETCAWVKHKWSMFPTSLYKISDVDILISTFKCLDCTSNIWWFVQLCFIQWCGIRYDLDFRMRFSSHLNCFIYGWKITSIPNPLSVNGEDLSHESFYL